MHLFSPRCNTAYCLICKPLIVIMLGTLTIGFIAGAYSACQKLYAGQLLSSQLVFSFMVVATIVLLLDVLLIKCILHKTVALPLAMLSEQIEATLNRGIFSLTSLKGLEHAPEEVLALKNSFVTALDKVQNEVLKKRQEAYDNALYDLAVHIVHDIRSPLAVMEIVAASTKPNDFAANRDMLRQAIHAVRKITNNMIIRPGREACSQSSK